jgi:putative transcriptional regulator
VFSFIETRLFTRLVQGYLSDDEYRELQKSLMDNPESGSVIPGSGGIRKVRWRAPGRGKRGGYRVIYYARSSQSVIWMLTMYPKNVAEKSPPTSCGRFERRLKMAKSKRNVGLEILQGLREIKRGDHGRVINIPEVAIIREKTGLSQARFAELLGVSVRTLQDWEQGRRAPSGAARTLLVVANKNPRVLLDVA